MKWVTDAKHIDSYKIWLKFNDKTEGVVDLEAAIVNDRRNIFKALRDRECFKRFKVDMDTIVWENGLDLAPEYFYDLAVRAAN